MALLYFMSQEAEESQVLGFFFTGFYEHSTGEASAYNSNKNHRVGTKHGVEGMKYDSASNHSDHYGGIARNPTDLMMHGYDNVNLTNVQRSEYVKSKPSISISNACVSMETKDRGPTAKMEKKSSGDRKARRQYDDLDELGMLSNEIMGSISGYCNVLRTFLFAFIASYEVNLRVRYLKFLLHYAYYWLSHYLVFFNGGSARGQQPHFNIGYTLQDLQRRGITLYSVLGQGKLY